jgi:hypothetical protein
VKLYPLCAIFSLISSRLSPGSKGNGAGESPREGAASSESHAHIAAAATQELMRLTKERLPSACGETKEEENGAFRVNAVISGENPHNPPAKSVSKRP